MMNDTLSMFFEELRLEEEAVAVRLATDKLGLVLRVALNELDWWSYNIVRAPETNREMLERWFLLRLGAARVAKLVFERNASFLSFGGLHGSVVS
jgi:hypothetical protein